MMERKWVGSHPQDLADGRVLAPGDKCVLSAVEERLPHNAALINSGGLIPVRAKHVHKKGDE